MRTVSGAPADQVSRLRRSLQTLLAECRRPLRVLLRPRWLLQGSVDELQTRCGKPSCHCASLRGPLHTATVLSWSERGHSRRRTLRPSDRARLRRLAQNYRRFRQARAALGKLHRRMLQSIDRLEKTLRLPPPPPAARRRKK